jgi:hypothetical protein
MCGTTTETKVPNTTEYMPVSEQAVIGRINRALKPQNQQLKVTRGNRAKLDFGAYHVPD